MKITYEAPMEGPVTAIREDIENVVDIHADKGCPLVKIEITEEEAQVLAKEFEIQSNGVMTFAQVMDYLRNEGDAQYNGVPIVIAN